MGARHWSLSKPDLFADGTNKSTHFESENVLVGTDTITINGQPCRVIDVAKLRGDKVYKYHHSRAKLYLLALARK